MKNGLLLTMAKIVAEHLSEHGDAKKGKHTQ